VLHRIVYCHGHGNAEKLCWDYAGEVPLVLKLTSQTEVPPARALLPPLNSSVRDAVRLGADAVTVTFPDPTAANEVTAPSNRDFTIRQATDSVVTRPGAPWWCPPASF
jgi:hypothetical protein